MDAKFRVTKEERKALVRAISDLTKQDAVYLGAPSFGFSVGVFTVDRDGTILCDDMDSGDLNDLVAELAARGFVHAAQNSDPLEPETGIPDRLSIDVPLDGLTPGVIDRIHKLVAAKAWIFRKMTGARELPIEQTEDSLRFPWFRPDASALEIEAYTYLVTRLCETAKTKQRVVAEERPLPLGDSEKFKARCTLLALGFIGPEFAQARKILLSPMSGNGSQKGAA